MLWKSYFILKYITIHSEYIRLISLSDNSTLNSFYSLLQYRYRWYIFGATTFWKCIDKLLLVCTLSFRFAIVFYLLGWTQIYRNLNYYLKFVPRQNSVVLGRHYKYKLCGDENNKTTKKYIFSIEKIVPFYMWRSWIIFSSM